MQNRRTRPIRRLARQFEPLTVRAIRDLQSRIADLPLSHQAARYLASELDRCLEAGLLYASTSVATALLELVLRSAVIQCRLAKRGAGRKTIGRLVRETEDERSLTLAPLAEELMREGFLTPEERARMQQINRRLRIPIHHATVARYVASRISDVKFLEELGLLDYGASHALEDALMDHSLRELDLVISAISLVVSKGAVGIALNEPAP